MTIFEIRNPKTDESTPAPFAHLLANLANQSPASIFKKLIFGHKDPVLFLEIAVYDQRIHFYMICEDYLRAYFQSQLSAQYPTAQILITTEYLDRFTHSSSQSFGVLKLQHVYYYPLTTYVSFKEKDPMGSMLSILARLTESEIGLIQIALRPAGTSWQSGAAGIVRKGVTDPQTGVRSPLPNESAISEKIKINGLATSIRLLVSGNSQSHTDTLLADLAGSFGVYARGDGNSLLLYKPGMFAKKKLLAGITNRNASHFPRYQVLNIDELASIYHPPSALLSGIKNIAWGGQLLSESPEDLPTYTPLTESERNDKSKKKTHQNRELNIFGRAEYKNKMHVFGIKREDRTRHMYVIGKTGTGKSTMIANMAINDMRNGEGLAIIDPHGDLCDTVLNYIPKNRINDVAYLDPSDTNYPFRLNPLELSQGGKYLNVDQYGAEMVASGIVSIFYKLYQHSWGPRMEYILRNTLLTMTQVPDSTLRDVVRMLSEAKYRKKIIDKLEDTILKNFWENEFNKMSDKLQTEAVAPIQNKIGQFVSSPLIRNIIGDPKSTINLADMMNEGKIVIVNLSQGKLGEDNAALLGAMFITKMQLAAMSRVYMDESKRRDFYLYVDEFQNFATKSFLKILSEARKYRLNLILANQYIGQIDEDVQKAIFGNVGTLISFLVGASDARALSFEFGEEYEQRDFVNLDNYRVLLKMAINGKTSSPFFAQTLPLPNTNNQNRQKVITVSRERYGRKRVK